MYRVVAVVSLILPRNRKLKFWVKLWLVEDWKLLFYKGLGSSASFREALFSLSSDHCSLLAFIRQGGHGPIPQVGVLSIFSGFLELWHV